jgi:5-oxopent-3-ene-1,2,5-tricarboxylate decarboxylase / 2-hydroxyhepta-2,4-diene-1,7-dioate isomerase
VPRNSFKLGLDFRPYELSGAVYGALLNHRSAVEAVAGFAERAPYNGLPRAPVLFIKPRNTLAACGEPIEVPEDALELEIAPMLGVVIGAVACRVLRAHVREFVAGYVIVNDVSVPHTGYHRPSVRYKARDGFCPLGPAVVRADTLLDPDAAVVRTYVDGALVQSANTAELVRSMDQLVCDVSEFMTLAPGDVLGLGAAAPAPRVRAGQTVAIEIDGIGRLENPVVAARA